MVNKCPKNQTEVYVASKRLGCGNDKYNNNQYMCLPNKEKNSLVEICYNGTMGKEDAGSCLEVTVDGFFRYNCSGFQSGCPNDTFLKSEIHNYPACQNINTERHCYNMEPSCQAQSPSEDMDFPSAIFYVFLVIGAIVVFISAIVIVRRNRQSKTVQTSGNDSEDKGISSNDLLVNDFEEINGENDRENNGISSNDLLVNDFEEINGENVRENNDTGGSENEDTGGSENEDTGGSENEDTGGSENEELTSTDTRRTGTEDIRRTVAEVLKDSRKTDSLADTRRRENEGDKLSGSLNFSSKTGNSSNNLLINDCKDISSIELETNMSSDSNKSTLKISINKDAQPKKNTSQSTAGLQ